MSIRRTSRPPLHRMGDQNMYEVTVIYRTVGLPFPTTFQIHVYT